MPEYNKVEAKVEEALGIVLLDFAGLEDEVVYVSQAAGVLEVPCTEIEARLGPEVTYGCGVFSVMVRVSVRTTADVDTQEETDPEVEHRARVGLVRDACLQEALPALLNAAGVAELTVLDVFVATEADSHGKDEERRHLVDSLGLRIVAANASI